jgi:hypothetical protein
MAPITVLLADLPSMLEDIVFQLLRGRAELRVVRGSSGVHGIQAAAAAAGAQVVIVERPDPAAFSKLDQGLAQAAGLSVLALNVDGSWACLHSLNPQTKRFDDISGAHLVSALASSAPAGRT